MKRHIKNCDFNLNSYFESKKIDLFLKEIVKVSKKHGFSISHEDFQGAFIIEKISDENIDWIENSHIEDKSVVDDLVEVKDK